MIDTYWTNELMTYIYTPCLRFCDTTTSDLCIPRHGNMHKSCKHTISHPPFGPVHSTTPTPPPRQRSVDASQKQEDAKKCTCCAACATASAGRSISQLHKLDHPPTNRLQYNTAFFPSYTIVFLASMLSLISCFKAADWLFMVRIE